jgi:hypothetical protein
MLINGNKIKSKVMLMKIKYFYTVYGEIDEKLQKRIPYGNYVYILNISGSDVCKIGYATYVFGRMNQIRRIVKSIFPFIENSITYNVYISSPLKDVESKRALESELHSIFKENNLDGEWFKCSFNEAISNLKERELKYIDSNNLKYILSLFDDKVYIRKEIFEKFNRLQYLKAFKELEFKKFAEHHSPELFDQNRFFRLNLNGPTTKENLINILKSFLEYIECNPGKSNYKKEVTKRINTFISESNIS